MLLRITKEIKKQSQELKVFFSGMGKSVLKKERGRGFSVSF